jgi:hypothetical protein
MEVRYERKSPKSVLGHLFSWKREEVAVLLYMKKGHGEGTIRWIAPG